MSLQRPEKAEMVEESWKSSFHVDSFIHLAGDLFIFDMNWPMLPVALVREAAMRRIWLDEHFIAVCEIA